MFFLAILWPAKFFLFNYVIILYDWIKNVLKNVVDKL